MPKINEDKKKQRRELILKKAMECFSKKGYSKTTMDDIVRSSGVSKGGIYIYFKSKEDIFKSIADDVLITRRSIIDNLNPEISYSEKFNKFVMTVIKSYHKEINKKRVRFGEEFWLESRNKKKIGAISRKEYIENRFRTAIEDVEGLIREGIKAGEFRKDINIISFINVLFTAIDGYAFYVSILDREMPVEIPEVFTDIFNSYLAN